ncbi:MAG: DUF3786 domain-containing protein [Candidatus Jettenia sp.]|uniref:DUF3786 domain-containing protein n=1 Tax=Candidatus Jettenia caeni TaxID=247490 RepID=I3IGV3_9BACT|nr:DUF3786 domain-containing protein [Candidatus Jettenia sp. AMX1]MBC6929704.1 DUF3786 domain-containing protein [Candidatus Jettenia sp.]NUN24179.1 DUF3786 domain-containing protein [Candidatus Jettenia caeni]KAA0248956.1 MAG: DUF3786 domain-containing protein [Candidatus Jettenia sp. AMX1]MCE7881249.1 DUF3786 domain-containing protein [Candidatus Jettenia sp. AMX1]MCQ3928090.1 DUF3786 domain-containing protein [Candidatus Jettenia sp.]
MKLDSAITVSWGNLLGSGISNNAKVQFLGDEYIVNIKLRKVLSLPHNTPIEDHLTVLILHYLSQKIAGLPVVSGEYLSFHGLSVINSFAEVFKKRSTDVIMERYGDNIFDILSVLHNLPAKKIDRADVAIVVEAFEGVPIFIELWEADEEFGPEANILFDKTIMKIFCVEDIVVLAEVVARVVSYKNDLYD